jgi:hypothetical protein
MKEKIYIYIPDKVAEGAKSTRSATGSEFVDASRLLEIMYRNNFLGAQDDDEKFLFGSTFSAVAAKTLIWVFFVDADDHDKMLAGCKLSTDVIPAPADEGTRVYMTLRIMLSRVRGACRRVCGEVLANVINGWSVRGFKGTRIPLFIESINDYKLGARAASSFVCYTRSFLNREADSYDFALMFMQNDEASAQMSRYDDEYDPTENGVLITRDVLETWLAMITIYMDLKNIAPITLSFASLGITLVFVPTARPNDGGGIFLFKVDKYEGMIKRALSVVSLDDDDYFVNNNGEYVRIHFGAVRDILFARELGGVHDELIENCKNPLELLKVLRANKFPGVTNTRLSGVVLDTQEARRRGYLADDYIFTYYAMWADAEYIVGTWKRPARADMLHVFSDAQDAQCTAAVSGLKNIKKQISRYIDGTTSAKCQKMGLGAGNIDFQTKQ